jgi:hypothetical protein
MPRRVWWRVAASWWSRQLEWMGFGYTHLDPLKLSHRMDVWPLVIVEMGTRGTNSSLRAYCQGSPDAGLQAEIAQKRHKFASGEAFRPS